MLRGRGVETVILAGADTHGIMRGKRLPIAELPRAAEHGVALCEVIWALPVDEREPVQRPPEHAGYFPRDGYPDMRAVPDLETARIVPWHDDTALVLCDFVDRDGGPVPVSPRAVLRSVVTRAQSMGIEPVVGVELEFYLLRETPQSVADKRPAQLVAVDERPSVYGVVAASRSEPFTGAVRDTLREYGLAVEACHPESGPGQFEINLRAAPALQAADEAFLLKSAVKEIAARQGLLATFMAKPRSDWPGSSCHLHLSLGGADLRHFIGGLLDGMAELTAIFAPTPNSYRRFAPYSWAGTTATWGVDNRSAGVRAIGGTRVEHRQAGADANPDPGHRGGARRRPGRRAARRRAAAPGRGRRVRVGGRPGAARDARRGHRPARAQRARPRLARRRRRRPLRGDAPRRARRAGRRRHGLGDRALPGRALVEPIIETVVTTLNPDGSVNCGAMGVEWGETRIVIKPYRGTRTLRNLHATGTAVVNLTDDILLFSQAALGDPHPPTHPAASVDGAVLDDACSWREVRVETIDDSAQRARVSTAVVDGGTGREFLGLNRARHAVLEASILASRVRMLDAEDIRAELDRLQVLIDKTGGPREREAMDYVRAVIGD